MPVLDLARLADALGPDHVVLARLHYFYDADPHLRELHRSGRIRDVASHPSIEELCLAADVLVTDYSSIMFDYAVLDRPIVIHAPDWEVYRALRGTYFDLMAEPPGVVARTEDELVEALRSRSAWGDEATGCAPRSARASARSTTAARPSAWSGAAVAAAMSRLILVVGVGRSGTSLLSGMLGQLGFHIPQPEVKADDTNPRGFGEPRWVVDFHTRLLRELRVTLNDARPAAWESTGATADDAAVYGELSRWLGGQLAEADALVVKDPRTVWFLDSVDAQRRRARRSRRRS